MKNLLSIVMVLCAAGAAAQTQDSIKSFNLNEVVVTGQYEPQSTRKSVYKVKTIPSEVIQMRGAVKLQDVLNTELNIRFSNDLTLGESSISMQGLDAQNVKILIDGVPMIGRSGTTNSVNINQINVNSIERVEIIEGPMSVVYGADALAGVINIITKKSADGKLDISAKVHEETVGSSYGGNEGIHNESVGVGYSLKKIYFRADLSRNDFKGWKGDSTGREMQWNPKLQWLVSGLAGIRTDRSNVYYRIDYTDEDIYNPGGFPANSTSDETLDQHFLTTRFMHQLQGSHTFSDRLSVNGIVSYSDFERRTQSTTYNRATGGVFLSLGAGQQDVTKFNGTTVRSTFQYKVSNNLTLQPGVDINTESGSGGRIKTGTQEISDYAFFVSGEWKISNVFSLRPGVRVIRNSVYNAPPAVPSLNAKITLSSKHDLRVSYGRGFRAPSLRELYFNFFDASHSIEGNPDLRAELSNSFNASWNWQVINLEGLKYSTVVGAFYNDVDNMIANGVNPAKPLVTSYINIDKYKTQGVTFNNNLKVSRFDISLGFAYTGRFNQYSEADAALAEFTWSPEINTTTSYRVPKAGLNFSVYYKYTGTTPFYQFDTSTQTATLAKISPYSWSDVSVQKTWASATSVLNHITLTGGVRNLFDVTNINSTAAAAGAHSTSGPRPIGYGRSYYFSISYLFNK